jgi:mycofactocin system glycosyltransferase
MAENMLVLASSAPPEGASLPPGTLLVADPSLEWMTDHLIAGGSPWRLLRLTDHAVALLSQWASGTRLSNSPTEGAFARRLVDAGFLHPVFPPRRPANGEIAIVIPVRDDAPGLERVLAALSSTSAAVTVVDDGSSDAGSIARTAASHGAKLIRCETSRGPGAARNRGLEATTSAFVAFLDCDVLPPDGWLDELFHHFDDPMVAAVAPRVRGPGGPGTRDHFEAIISPLDLGSSPGIVRPSSAIPFVPGTALIVRRSALGVPFDETLRIGEDVDLVWRLSAAGWVVRYDPSVVVFHPARDSWPAWIAQRFKYGRSAGPLEARHGDNAAPLHADPRVMATWALVLAGRPRLALGMLSWSAASLSRRLEGIAERGGREAVARKIAARGIALAGPGLARSTFRNYGPYLILGAVVFPPLRRPVLTLTVAATAVRWWYAGKPKRPVSFAVLSIAEDFAYAAGVLEGVVRTRRLGALRPRLRPATTTAPTLSAS